MTAMSRATGLLTKNPIFRLQQQMGMPFFSSFPFSTTCSSSGTDKVSFSNIDDALAFFNDMLSKNPRPSTYDFNQLLSAVMRMKKHETVVSLSKEMELRGVKHNVFTLTILINCFCHSNRVDFGFSVWGKILKRGFERWCRLKVMEEDSSVLKSGRWRCRFL